VETDLRARVLRVCLPAVATGLGNNERSVSVIIDKRLRGGSPCFCRVLPCWDLTRRAEPLVLLPDRTNGFPLGQSAHMASATGFCAALIQRSYLTMLVVVVDHPVPPASVVPRSNCPNRRSWDYCKRERSWKIRPLGILNFNARGRRRWLRKYGNCKRQADRPESSPGSTVP
jgi:hypothetical protein